MLSKIPCKCKDKDKCGGFFTTTEIAMNRTNPKFTVQEYHEILELFLETFDG